MPHDMRGIWFLLGWALALGCTTSPPVIPESLQQDVDTTVTFLRLRDHVDAYQGRVVVLGGEVLSATGLTEGTRLEVLHLPLGTSHEPSRRLTDSQGRFMAVEPAFLDPATLPPHTRVTVVGEVTGQTRGKVDEMDYLFPTVAIKHVHVWEEPSSDPDNGGGPRFGVFGGGRTGGRVGGGVSIGIGF